MYGKPFKENMHACMASIHYPIYSYSCCCNDILFESLNSLMKLVIYIITSMHTIIINSNIRGS